MTRYAVGITLPEHQRRQLFGGARSGSELVRSHTCEVTLPDGSACTVTYTRYNGQSHQLDYGRPIHQRVWVMRRINEGVAGVEEAAVQHAEEAFRKAQEAEQKEMCRKTPPNGAQQHTNGDASLYRAKADRLAGRYAVCLRFASGRLLRIGHPRERPEEAQEDLHQSRPTFQNGNLVVGICNRWARCWQEPRFLPAPPPVTAEPEPQPTAPSTDEAKKPKRPRRSRRAPAAKAQKSAATPPEPRPEAESVQPAESAPAPEAPIDPAFAQWMSEVEEILMEHTGMTTSDLRHCHYHDWYEAAYTPEEAVREALGTNGLNDNLDEPFAPA